MPADVSPIARLACLFLRSYRIVKVPKRLVLLLSAVTVVDKKAVVGTVVSFWPISNSISTQPFPCTSFPEVTPV